jgi:hypothetical protein
MSAARGHEEWDAAEAEVLGALLRGAPYDEIARILGPEHFSRAGAALIYRAIAQLATAGSVTAPGTVAERLEQTGHLQAAGGLPTLLQLANTISAKENMVAIARIVRERADCRRLQQLAQQRDGAEMLDAAQQLLSARAELATPAAPTIVLRHVADIVEERRETEWLGGLHKILERRVIAILAGFRDTLKSFVGTHWAMTAAISGESVVILSGEGGGLGRRIEAWMQELAPGKKLRDLRLLALERPLRLNATEVMTALAAAIDAAGIIPTLILIDTLSKFTPGMKENASEEVAAFLHLLSSMIRERYGCTILLIAHAGHGDAKRPRGSSVIMSNPDAEYIAEKPDPNEQAILISRDRFKDSPKLPPLAYAARVVDLGREDAYGERVTSLVLSEAASGAVIASKPGLKGGAQRKLLAALQERSPDGSAIWTLEDLRAIGTKELNLPKSSARCAANFLTTSGHLGATAGGWKLNP